MILKTFDVQVGTLTLYTLSTVQLGTLVNEFKYFYSLQVGTLTLYTWSTVQLGTVVSEFKDFWCTSRYFDIY